MRGKKIKLDRHTRRAITNAIRESTQATSKIQDYEYKSIKSAWSFTGTVNPATKVTVDEPIDRRPIVDLIHPTQYTFDMIHFHAMVMNKQRHIEYIYVARPYGQDRQLAFLSKDDHDIGQAWLEKYLEKFSQHTDLSFPPPTDGYYPFTVRTNHNSEIRTDQWLWALDNCEGEVRQSGDFWFFMNESDATLFELAHRS